MAEAGDTPVSLSLGVALSLLLPGASCADMWRACMLPSVGERWMLRVTLVRRGLLGRRREEGDLANSRTTGMSDDDSLALNGVLYCDEGQAAVVGGVLACAVATCPSLSSADGFTLTSQTDGGVDTAACCSAESGSCWQDDGARGLHILRPLCSRSKLSCNRAFVRYPDAMRMHRSTSWRDMDTCLVACKRALPSIVFYTSGPCWQRHCMVCILFIDFERAFLHKLSVHHRRCDLHI